MDGLSYRVRHLWLSCTEAAGAASLECHLFRLPREVRDMIWRLALIQNLRERHAGIVEAQAADDAARAAAIAAAPYRSVPSHRTLGTTIVMSYQRWNAPVPRAAPFSFASALRAPRFVYTCQLMQRECEKMLWGELTSWIERDFLSTWIPPLDPPQIRLLLFPDTRSGHRRSKLLVQIPHVQRFVRLQAARRLMPGSDTRGSRRARSRVNSSGTITFAKDLGWGEVKWDVEEVEAPLARWYDIHSAALALRRSGWYM